MVTPLRWLGLIVLLIASWVGCSSDGDNSGSRAAGGARPTGGQRNAAGDSGDTSSSGGRGSEGVGGTGASSGTLGDAGSAGLSDSAGGLGPRPIPAEWACIYFTYGDGKCDCGCGAPDIDCDAQALARCEVCNSVGACSVAECPGRIDPQDVTQCLPVPKGWTCSADAYSDGKCDCGCGVRDRDCPNADATSCDRCDIGGSCANGVCPSSIAASDNARCEIPVRWTCAASTYGDGICNCGCGVVDVDCPNTSIDSCQKCDQSSCSPIDCAVFPADNAHCAKPPATWNCPARLYHDGIRCDCACGAPDPDCESSSVDVCDKCDSPGSCSAQPCPGLVSPRANGLCDQPPAPVGWTCPYNAYADGIACDCGCGLPDPDCRTADFRSCVRCLTCGGKGVCEGNIDLADTTQCGPPPPAWTCSTAAYRDEICDCGCGLQDAPCQGIPLRYVCGNYPVEGCTAGHREHIDPNDNSRCNILVPSGWTCDRTFYDDGLCDCGCGVVDSDCSPNQVSSCEQCDGAGSCSRAACPGTIAPDDTAHCAP